MDVNNNNNNNNSHNDTKQRFSPSKFFELLFLRLSNSLKVWTPRIVYVVDYLYPITGTLGSFFKRFVQYILWFRQPRWGADLFFFRFELAYHIFVRFLIFYFCFYCWRWGSGFSGSYTHSIPSILTMLSPLDTLFGKIDGPLESPSLTVVDYCYMIERYAEPSCAYHSSSERMHVPFWKVIYLNNKQLLGWRPSMLTAADVTTEVNRIISHVKSLKYPDAPLRMRYFSVIYGVQDYVSHGRYDIHWAFPKPLSWFLGVERIDIVWFDLLDSFFRKHGINQNPFIYRKNAFITAAETVDMYYTWTMEEYPNWLKNGLPDEWYMRYERPMYQHEEGLGGWYVWDDLVHDPFRQVYADLVTRPWDKFRAERWEYFMNLTPSLPNWGPGRGLIKHLFLDIIELFWVRYLAPAGNFLFFARFSDLLVLFDHLGTYIVYFISFIYGLPFLVVTYVCFFAVYFFTPLKIVVAETIISIVDTVFMHCLEIITIFENNYLRPTAVSSYGDFLVFWSTAWMGFLFIPFLVVMVVIPLYFLFGFCITFFIRPGAYLYFLFVDEETGTIRTKNEVWQICKDQLVVITNVVWFRFIKNSYSLKSLLTSLPHHNPPVILLPRRWFRTFWFRWPGVKQSIPWWVFHSKTSAVIGLADYLQFKADTLFIRKFGEEAFQKELDKRYWMEMEEFDVSWTRYTFITHSLVKNRQSMIFFCWFGHIIFLSFISFWCFGVLYKKVLFLRLFSDSLFANGLPPLCLGTAAYPKSIRVSSDFDDQRHEGYEPFTDIEELLYPPEEQITHIDHYAEFILVISKWFLVYFSFFIFVCGSLFFFYRGPRAIFLTYASEFSLGFISLIFGMGWSAYAFAGGFPEWDLLGFRWFLNLLLVGEEISFDNYLTGYFADDLTILGLERYIDEDWYLFADITRLYVHKNFHVRYWGKLYMRVYSPIEELLWPIADFIETYRDEEWKEFLEKYEPQLKKFRVYFWDEEEVDEYADDPDRELGRIKRPKTGKK